MNPGRPAIAAIAAIALLLSGCTAPAELPDAVTVSVFQNRLDYGIRQLEIKVSNGTDAPITVTRASLESTRFAAPAVWDRPQEIPAGGARDLKVLLTDPVCDPDDEPRHAVVLDYALADGSTGTATLTPTDENDRLTTINDQDCLAVSAAAIATITAPATVTWTPGGHAPATLDIAVEPSGGSGPLTIHRAKGTVLLGLVDETGAAIDLLSVELTVDADAAASVIRIAVVPTRCDPHAIAEDKRGTFFPLDVEASDGRFGTIYVAVGDEVRGSLYEFYSDYCGLP